MLIKLNGEISILSEWLGPVLKILQVNRLYRLSRPTRFTSSPYQTTSFTSIHTPDLPILKAILYQYLNVYLGAKSDNISLVHLHPYPFFLLDHKISNNVRDVIRGP